jgi:hypothetical protein
VGGEDGNHSPSYGEEGEAGRGRRGRGGKGEDKKRRMALHPPCNPKSELFPRSCYETIPMDFPTFANTSNTRSICASVCVAM